MILKIQFMSGQKCSINTYKHVGILKLVAESKEKHFEICKFAGRMRALFRLYHQRNPELKNKEKSLKFKSQLRLLN